MKDRDGKILRIGDKVRYYTKHNDIWLLGTVNAFGENLISIERENNKFMLNCNRFFPRPSEYVVKATKEVLLLHKLEN
jgi:hypothetical protein